MEIYLISKEHGRKIASAEEEAKQDKLNGWGEVNKDEYFQRDKKEDVKPVKTNALAAASFENVESINKTGKKRGRPKVVK